MKKEFKLLLFLFVCVLIINSFNSTVFAYYNRGKVTLSVGSTNVTIPKGNSSNITVRLSPASRTGLPGCGDAGCPQTCGGMCGDEKNGECPCAGNTPVTQNATASVQSANSTIAKATYSNGAITVTGLSEGKTQITVIGSLWQYTNSDLVIINVTVTSSINDSSAPSKGINSEQAVHSNPTSSNNNSNSSTASTDNNPKSGDISVSTNSSNVNSNKTGTSSSNVSNSGIVAITPSSGNSSTSNNSNSSGIVAVSPDSNRNNTNASNGNISSQTSSETKNAAEIKENITTVNGNKGTIEIVSLTDNTKTGKEELKKIKGQDIKITFQKKDINNNILYSWSYNGKDIKDPKDIDMSISFPGITEKESQISKNLINPLLITFAHSGDLPGKATVYIKASSQYKNNDILSLYYYNKNTGKLELVQKNIKVSGGYISFNITHCSEYFLASSMKGSTNLWGIIGIIVISIIACMIFLFIKNTNILKRIFKTSL